VARAYAQDLVDLVSADDEAERDEQQAHSKEGHVRDGRRAPNGCIPHQRYRLDKEAAH
jgi:hypothetical protein